MNRQAVARELVAIARELSSLDAGLSSKMGRVLMGNLRYTGPDSSKAFRLSTTLRVPIQATVSVHTYDDAGEPTTALSYEVEYDEEITKKAVAQQMVALVSAKAGEPVFLGGSGQLLSFANRFDNESLLDLQ